MRRQADSGRSVAKWIAAFLAIAVNLGFVLFLIFHVTWRNPPQESVVVELYAPSPPIEKIEAPKTQPELPPEPPPQVEPPKVEPPKAEPPKPSPKIEPPRPPPKVEPPPPPKPDITLKEKQAKAERERKEREKLEAEKREAEKREVERKQQEKRLAELRERQAREAEALRAQAARERLAQQQIALNAARAKADADYIRRVQAKIRGNVVLPPDMPGNPEAVFGVVQLPTGEIIDVQLEKSSGVRAYDEAVQRAILKSSPLPRPDNPDMFRRNLTLKFRPLD
jgi:colicin import membrane protein